MFWRKRIKLNLTQEDQDFIKQEKKKYVKGFHGEGLERRPKEYIPEDHINSEGKQRDTTEYGLNYLHPKKGSRVDLNTLPSHNNEMVWETEKDRKLRERGLL